VLLGLAYLGVTNAFAMLCLLPMSDRGKDAEILALRHQIMVLERQLGERKVRFNPGRPGIAGGTDSSAATGRAPQSAVAGAPGHGAGLAP
jgi:hypothetical protein